MFRQFLKVISVFLSWAHTGGESIRLLSNSIWDVENEWVSWLIALQVRKTKICLEKMLPQNVHSKNKLILTSKSARMTEQACSRLMGTAWGMCISTVAGEHTEWSGSYWTCDHSSQGLCLCGFSVLKRQNDEKYVDRHESHILLLRAIQVAEISTFLFRKKKLHRLFYFNKLWFETKMSQAFWKILVISWECFSISNKMGIKVKKSKFKAAGSRHGEQRPRRTAV